MSQIIRKVCDGCGEIEADNKWRSDPWVSMGGPIVLTLEDGITMEAFGPGTFDFCRPYCFVSKIDEITETSKPKKPTVVAEESDAASA